MYGEYAARLGREDWGSHVTQQDDYLKSIAESLTAIKSALADAGINVSLPHESQPPLTPVTAQGVTMLAQELSLLLGKEKPLTQRDRLNVDTTLPNSDTEGAVKLQAFKNNVQDESDEETLPIALNIADGYFKYGDNIIFSIADGSVWGPIADIPEIGAGEDASYELVLVGGVLKKSPVSSAPTRQGGVRYSQFGGYASGQEQVLIKNTSNTVSLSDPSEECPP